MLKVISTHEIAAGTRTLMYSGTPLVEHEGDLWITYALKADGHVYLSRVMGDETVRVSHVALEPGKDNVHWAPAVGVWNGELVVAYPERDAGHGCVRVPGKEPIDLACRISMDYAFDGPWLHAAGALVGGDGFDWFRFGLAGVGRVVVNARTIPGGYEQVEFRARAGRAVWLAVESPNQVRRGPLCAAEVSESGRFRPLGSSAWESPPLDAQAARYRIFDGDVDMGSECSWDLDAAGGLVIALKTPRTGRTVAGRCAWSQSPDDPRCDLRLWRDGEVGEPIPVWVRSWTNQHPVVWGDKLLATWGDYAAGARADLHVWTGATWLAVAGSGVIDAMVDYRLADGRLALACWERATGKLWVLILEEE